MTGRLVLAGLTGAIGSGKSLVAGVFRELGAQVVDADAVSRELLEREAAGWQAIRQAFGERFFTLAHNLDRAKLRSAIFNDKALRTRVDALLHPLIRRKIKEICGLAAKEAGNGTLLIVVEVPLLYEAGWQDDFDVVVVVNAARAICLDRIKARDKVTARAGERALAAQMDIEKKVSLADHVIDNSGDVQATRRQIEVLVKKLIG